MRGQYRIMGYYSREDEAYIVFAPDLPGCFADGATKEEAKENIAVIIDEWITDAEALGRDIPEPLGAMTQTGASVLDVAEYILSKTGKISAMMLEKLTYYCQAWSLGWFHETLFPQGFQAWEHGPVCKSLFDRHKGRYVVSPGDIDNGNTHRLSETEKKLIHHVLSVYGDQSPEWLSALSHTEPPWRAARGKLPEGASSNNRIDPAEMEAYYSSIA